MQKVIGLDIGSYSIKAIEIINTFKSYEVANFYETIIPNLDGVPLEAVVPVCMEQLFRENNLEADRILTAMPGQFISSRIIPFNFSDPRKIESSIAVELEEYVPFNMDDMILNHQILGNVSGKTLVLAVMTRKAFLRNFLDLLGRIHIDPKLVDIDSLAFYNLSSHLHFDRDQCFAMVDVGHEKTSICIVRDGVLRMFRSINLGGRYMTEFLARDLELTFFEAQRTKHRVSRVFCNEYKGDDLDAADREVADRITIASNAIVKELGRTFYAFKSSTMDPPQKIYLSGGTSAIKHFAAFLSEQLEIECEKIELNQTGLKITDDVALKMEVVPQSLAIGLRAVSTVKKHSQINLRRGEFSYVQNYENVIKMASRAFRLIAVVIALLIVSYVFKSYFYSSQIAGLKSQYQKEFLTVFPDQAKKFRRADVTFSKLKKDAESMIKSGIADKHETINQYILTTKGSGALRLLKEISEQMPEEIPLDVTLYEYKTTLSGEGKLTLRAETDNFSSQAAIIDALKKVPTLSSVEEKSSGAKPGSDGKKIEFTVQASYKTNIKGLEGG